MELLCFLWSAPEQTVEQTIVGLVIWDAIAPIMTSQWCQRENALLLFYAHGQYFIEKEKLVRGNCNKQWPFRDYFDCFYSSKLSVCRRMYKGSCINSHPLSVANMRPWIGSALAQIVACRLFGAKPSYEPELGHCQFGPLGTNWSETLIKIWNLSFKKMLLEILSAKWRPFCPGGDELSYMRSNYLQWDAKGRQCVHLFANIRQMTLVVYSIVMKMIPIHLNGMQQYI